MEVPQIAIAPFYQGWETFQQHLLKVITPLTPEHLTLKVAPHQWSVSMLMRHLISARVGWFQGWMGEGSSEVEEMGGWDEEMGEQLVAADLVRGLEATWQMIDSALQRWTTADMDKTFRSPWNPNRPEQTRQWIIWHVLEHDLFHGGEISLILGANGLDPIDL